MGFTQIVLRIFYVSMLLGMLQDVLLSRDAQASCSFCGFLNFAGRGLNLKENFYHDNIHLFENDSYVNSKLSIKNCLKSRTEVKVIFNVGTS